MCVQQNCEYIEKTPLFIDEHTFVLPHSPIAIIMCQFLISSTDPRQCKLDSFLELDKYAYVLQGYVPCYAPQSYGHCYAPQSYGPCYAPQVMALVKIAIFEFVSASLFIYYQFSDVCQTYTVISILKQVCI